MQNVGSWFINQCKLEGIWHASLCLLLIPSSFSPDILFHYFQLRPKNVNFFLYRYKILFLFQLDVIIWTWNFLDFLKLSSLLSTLSPWANQMGLCSSGVEETVCQIILCSTLVCLTLTNCLIFPRQCLSESRWTAQCHKRTEVITPQGSEGEYHHRCQNSDNRSTPLRDAGCPIRWWSHVGEDRIRTGWTRPWYLQSTVQYELD